MFPSTTTTGCPTLTRHDGDLTLTTPGQVVEKVDVHGYVYVQAPGVKFLHSIARGGVPATTGQTAILNVNHSLATDFVSEDVTLTPKFPNANLNGVYVDKPSVFRRLDVSGTVDGFVIYGDRVVVEDSYLHNFPVLPTTRHSDGVTHNDGIQLQKGIGVQIIGNTIVGANNAAIMVTQDVGIVGDLLITHNFLDGGGATVNFGSTGAIKKNLVVTHNTFGPYRRNKGMAIIRNATQSPVVAFGNVWADTNLSVTLTNGS